LGVPNVLRGVLPVALSLLVLFPAAARADAGQSLRWAPPVLTNPTTIQLGQGVTNTTLDTSKDYIVKLPPYQKLGGTEIQGGRNVVIEGGSISIPPNMSSDAARNGIYVKNNVGTVHIEGVLIDGSAGGVSDGIDISAPQSTVQIENVRVMGLMGGYTGFHSDVIQPWGGVRELRVDGLTGSSNYQGLTLARDLGDIGSGTLQRVNLSQTDGPYDGGGHMLWLTTGLSTCNSYPVSLASFYIQPRAGRSLGTSVWPPQVGSSLLCPALSFLGGSAGWSSLPVSGQVDLGPPPGGDFVPAGRAGLDYTSPGYGVDAVAPADPVVPADPVAPAAPATPPAPAVAPAGASHPARVAAPAVAKRHASRRCHSKKSARKARRHGRHRHGARRGARQPRALCRPPHK
jgi:hypothetical protein